MNTASSTLNPADGFLIRRWGLWDLGFGLLAALGAAFATQRYASFMDIYNWSFSGVACLLLLYWAISGLRFGHFLWDVRRLQFLQWRCMAALRRPRKVIFF